MWAPVTHTHPHGPVHTHTGPCTQTHTPHTDRHHDRCTCLLPFPLEQVQNFTHKGAHTPFTHAHIPSRHHRCLLPPWAMTLAGAHALPCPQAGSHPASRTQAAVCTPRRPLRRHTCRDAASSRAQAAQAAPAVPGRVLPHRGEAGPPRPPTPPHPMAGPSQGPKERRGGSRGRAGDEVMPLPDLFISGRISRTFPPPHRLLPRDGRLLVLNAN